MTATGFGPPWHIESQPERTTSVNGVTISATAGPICVAPLIVAPLIVHRVNCHDELVAALEAAYADLKRNSIAGGTLGIQLRAALAKAKEALR